MKRLILLLIAAVAAFAQAPVYTAFSESNLTAAATALTIQQPASPSKTARVMGAMVYCSVACTITLENATTGASSTNLPPVAVSPGYSAATILARSASNVASGSVVTRYTLAAGETKTLDSEMALLPVANYSLTLRAGIMTGTVRMTWVWRED